MAERPLEPDTGTAGVGTSDPMSQLDASSATSLSAHISGATLSFAGRVLFDSLDVTLEAGRWTCLLGPTGVGKTSLLRLFAGLAAADGDRVVACGDGEPIAGRVAALSPQALLMPWGPVTENVVIRSLPAGCRSVRWPLAPRKGQPAPPVRIDCSLWRPTSGWCWPSRRGWGNVFPRSNAW